MDVNCNFTHAQRQRQRFEQCTQHDPPIMPSPAGRFAELKLALCFLRDAEEPDNDGMLSSYRVGKSLSQPAGWQVAGNGKWELRCWRCCSCSCLCAAFVSDWVHDGATISSLLSLSLGDLAWNPYSSHQLKKKIIERTGDIVCKLNQHSYHNTAQKKETWWLHGAKSLQTLWERGSAFRL